MSPKTGVPSNPTAAAVELVLADSRVSRATLYVDPELACSVCGCTNTNACAGGCSWTLPGLCSRCAERVSLVRRASKVAEKPVFGERVVAGRRGCHYPD